MADNTKQARWIVVLYGNLSALFAGRPDVFVAADLLWYPDPTDDAVRAAPDVMLAFGRPKGDRGSYKQWEEDDVPVTVAFEVLSPGNKKKEMDEKKLFYEEHGVEEYYVYDPDRNRLQVFLRQPSGVFRRHSRADGFRSPRMGVRFDLSSCPEMRVFYPNGDPFLTFEEVKRLADDALRRAETAEQRAGDAERRAGDAERRAGDAERRAGRLAELSLKVMRGHATAEELAELGRLAGDHP